MEKETLKRNFSLSHDQELMDFSFRQFERLLSGEEINSEAMGRTSFDLESDYTSMVVVENPNMIHLIEAKDTTSENVRTIDDGSTVEYLRPEDVKADPLTFHLVSPDREYRPFETSPESLIIYRDRGLEDYSIALQDELERRFDTEAKRFAESKMSKGQDRADYLENRTEVLNYPNKYGHGPNGI